MWHGSLNRTLCTSLCVVRFSALRNTAHFFKWPSRIRLLKVPESTSSSPMDEDFCWLLFFFLYYKWYHPKYPCTYAFVIFCFFAKTLFQRGIAEFPPALHLAILLSVPKKESDTERQLLVCTGCCLVCFCGAGNRTQALYMLSMHWTTKLYPSLWFFIFSCFWGVVLKTDIEMPFCQSEAIITKAGWSFKTETVG